MTQFTGVREDLAEWNRLSVKVGRGVIRRFDRARAAFYRRCKEGGRPGGIRASSLRTVGVP